MSWFLMMISVGKIALVLAFLLLPAGVMAAAPISTIVQGNTVFLGEEGLDVTQALNGAYFGEACGAYVDTANLTGTPHLAQIGWWASAANIYNTAPSRTIDISSRYTTMMIAPSDFVGYTGNWYLLESNGAAYKNPVPGCGCDANGCSASLVFTVQDPNLDIRVYDATLGVDATANGWITTDDEVEFRITTNLYQIADRPGVSAVPIKISVQSPDGAIYSALVNKAGTTTSLTDVPVSTSPSSTGPIWDTGRHDTYPYGSYIIWAECNVNSMKDNYPVSGKTYTPGSGILDQERNPIIDVNARTATQTTVATSAPTVVKTMPPTTVQTALTTPATLQTTLSAVPPTVSLTATPTKSPGFESIVAGAGLLLALAWFVRKE
jgi:hypothetical protein